MSLSMNDDELDAWFEEARAACCERREAVAVEILGRYTARRPDDAYAWYVLGDALRVVSRAEDARQALARVEAMTPEENKFRVRVSLGEVEQDCGAHERAEEWFRQAAESPEGLDVGWVWIKRGINLMDAGRLADAERCHRRATTLPTERCDRDEAWLNVGLVLVAQRRYDEAAVAFREACALDPEWAVNQEARQSLVGMDDVLQRLRAFDD